MTAECIQYSIMWNLYFSCTIFFQQALTIYKNLSAKPKTNPSSDDLEEYLSDEEDRNAAEALLKDVKDLKKSTN